MAFASASARGGPFHLQDGQVHVGPSRFFGCIACGQCVAVCPQGCITVSGRDLFPSDAVDLPPPESRATFGQLQVLLLARRSVRSFRDREVERELIEEMLSAATTAPMGVPPSEVGVLVLAGKDRVKRFRDDLLRAMQAARWMFSPAMLLLLRPFIGKEAYEGFRCFVAPVVDAYLEKDREGVDWFFYDAPLALFFYGSPYADPADALIAATYAMLAGEALGLGSCMLGFPGYILKYSAGLKRKYGLPPRMQPGVAIVFGYPDVRYRRAITRRFAAVRYG